MRLHHTLSLKALPVTLLTLSAPFLLSTQAQARAFRVSQAPNNQWGCLLCHNGSGGPRNSFGGDVESTLSGGNVNWSAICDLDSDGDGFTNGQELGDPECLWSMGQANPPGPVTQPFNAQDVPQEPMGGEPMGGEPMGGVMGGVMGGEPVGGEPAGGVMGGEPAGGEPMGGEPAGGEPAGGEPAGGEPAGGEPAGGVMGGEPAGGEPAGGVMGGEPAGGEPAGGVMGGEPAGGVMGGEPAGGEPAGGEPAGGEPAGGEPAGGEPAYTGEVSQPDEGCQSAPGRPSWLTLALLLGFFATRRRSA